MPPSLPSLPSFLLSLSPASELRTKDLERVNKAIADLKAKEMRGLTKDQKEELAIAEKVCAWLEADKDVRHGDWSAREVEWLNTNPLISAKPVAYLVNLTEKAYTTKKSKWLPKVAAWVADHGGGPVIPFSGAFESRLADMPEDEAAVSAEEAGAPSALPKIIRTGFAHIQLIYFFTAGEDEVKCWQVRKGCKAPQAAGAIHTDFERGFICAEVMHYEDLKELGTEAAVKAAGKYRQEGKLYTVLDGDVIYFKFNVTAPAKK